MKNKLKDKQWLSIYYFQNDRKKIFHKHLISLLYTGQFLFPNQKIHVLGLWLGRLFNAHI